MLMVFQRCWSSSGRVTGGVSAGSSKEPRVGLHLQWPLKTSVFNNEALFIVQPDVGGSRHLPGNTKGSITFISPGAYFSVRRDRPVVMVQIRQGQLEPLPWRQGYIRGWEYVSVSVFFWRSWVEIDPHPHITSSYHSLSKDSFNGRTSFRSMRSLFLYKHVPNSGRAISF